MVEPLTPEAVREMPAGAEMDLLVLERVFGFPRRKVFDDGAGPYYIPSGKAKRTHMIDARPVPHFSTFLLHAWEVKCEMLTRWERDDRGMFWEGPEWKDRRMQLWDAEGEPDLHDVDTRSWFVTLRDLEGGAATRYIVALTAPLAICRAALLSTLSNEEVHRG